MKVSQEIADLIPYSPGKPIEETKRELGLTEVVKLASNENPLGPSPLAVSAMRNALENVHRYPDASCYDLSLAIANRFGLERKDLVFGNGSNELIDLLIRVFCEPGDSILTSDGAFIAYQICAQAARVKVEKTPLNQETMGFDLAAMAKRISDPTKPCPKLVFLANPNNPTGTYISKSELSDFLAVAGGRDDLLVVIDEAYNEFVRAEDYPDTLELFKEHSNLVVMRTLSKVYGLAGVRVGWLTGPDFVIDFLNRVRNPFNVNSLAQVAAIAGMEDKDFLRQAQQVNWSGLDYFYGELKRLGLPFWESQGNFVLFDAGSDSQEFYLSLLKRGVILRPVKGYGLATHLRMSVGLESENKKAIKAIEEVIKELGK